MIRCRLRRRRYLFQSGDLTDAHNAQTVYCLLCFYVLCYFYHLDYLRLR